MTDIQSIKETFWKIWNTFSPQMIRHIVHPVILLLVVGTYAFLKSINFYLGWLYLIPVMYCVSIWCTYLAGLKMEDPKDVPALVVSIPIKNKKSKDAKLKKAPKVNFVEASQVCDYVADSRDVSISIGEKASQPESKEGLHWLNKSIEQIWINKRAAVEDIVLNVVWPKVKKILAKLPIKIKIELYSFSLGLVPPHFRRIFVHEVQQEEDSMIIDIDLGFASEAAVKVKIETDVIPRVTLLVDSVYVDVGIRIALRGISKHPPYVQGFEVTLLHQPEIHWNLGDLARMANIAFIDRTIRKLINDNVKILVIPNKLSIPICVVPLPRELGSIMNTDEKAYSESGRIVIPNPEGIVRVVLEKTANIPPMDMTSSLLYPSVLFKSPRRFFTEMFPSKKSSDPYAVVRIGSHEYRTKTVYKELNATFNTTFDIPVYCPLDQHLEIVIYDEDFNTDDIIGKIIERLEDIKDNYSVEKEAKWRGLSNTNNTRAYLKYLWISEQIVDKSSNLDSDGLLAFSCIGIYSTSLCKPKISIKLTDMSDEGHYLTDRSWKAIMAFKELKEFTLSNLSLGLWDLFNLQGGMLRLLKDDTTISIEVEDSLEREDEVGRRKWIGEVAIQHIIERGEEPIELQLSKTYKKKQSFVNKSVKKLSLLAKTMLGTSGGTVLQSEEEESMKIKLQCVVYRDVIKS